MNIRDIIAEEVRTTLKESGGAEVTAGLDKLIQEVPGVIPELEKTVATNILPYISIMLKTSLKEGEEEGGEESAGARVVAAGEGAAKTAGYVLSHLPYGKKMGVMIATALDQNTDDHVRNAVLFAIGNLLAGSMGVDLPDLGHLLQEIPEGLWEMLPFTDNDQEWDWGAINAIDDAVLLTWAWLKVKKSVNVEEKLHEFGKFIGRSDLGKQPEAATAGAFDRDDMSLDARSARAGAAKEKGKNFRGIKEMKIKKSEIYNIIKEELEVILTNEEVEEVFNLDLSALLDEMVTISTDDLYLAEMFDTGSDTKESCAAKGGQWNEAAQKCEFLEEAQIDEMMNEENEFQRRMAAAQAQSDQRGAQKAGNQAEFQKRMAAAKGAGNIDQAKKASNQNEFQKRMAAAQAQSGGRGAQKAGNQAEFQKRMAAAKGAGNIDQAKKASNQNEFQKRMAAARGLEEKKLSSKERKDMSSSSFIFPKERKFPIPDESHGRNALSRANQYSSAPSWYDGSLESLVKKVHSVVKKKFPGIETTPASAKPGKG